MAGGSYTIAPSGQVRSPSSQPDRSSTIRRSDLASRDSSCRDSGAEVSSARPGGTGIGRDGTDLGRRRGTDSHGSSPMALLLADSLRAGPVPALAVDSHPAGCTHGLGAPADRGTARGAERPTRGAGWDLRRPGGRDSPDQPADRLATRHHRPVAEGRRGSPRLRAVQVVLRPLQAVADRGGRGRAASAPPRRWDGRAGGPGPARTSGAGRFERVDTRRRAPRHRPGPSGQRDGRRRADPDPARATGRRGRGIHRGADIRHRAAPGADQRRGFPVRRADGPHGVGALGRGPAPRRRRGARRRHERPSVRRARPRRRRRR